ncbi:MAG: B12-binding domain-containing radical SAM protein [Candidatus Methylarchaceae archaeon HK01B]|nr:B12-binding domain-containing radical SAM protein [Candidatus Methylarchaceae archaeon HK02M1]MCP8318981.1 B12-binding domain-containing radical SAM protein [Candidatus Methylarchaceae archaeon HK01B]
MKFSFINPGPSEAWTHVVTAPASWPPLGILYIATILKQNNFDVSILDVTNQTSLQGILKWVEKEDPEFLGFSTLSSSGRSAAMIAERVKERNPNIKIAFGNYHATFNAKRILEKYPFVDLIVRNEAEFTCLELAKCLEEGKELKDVKGITFRDGDKIVFTPDRSPLKDLDRLPFPDRKLLKNDYRSTLAGLALATGRFTTVVSSRGCPYNCRYCACSLFARRTWRPRSPKNIIDELELLYSEGFRQIIFVDDNFALNQKRVIKICQLMKKNKIEMDWICDARVDCISREALEAMAKTGCRVIYYGMESANQRILDFYDKGITPSQSRTAAKATRKAGIDIIVGSFIIGAPDETREEIRNTFAFAQQIDIDIPLFHPLEIQPGTPLWMELSSQGLLNEDEHWEKGVYASEICPQAVPLEELYPMMIHAVKKFLIRPEYIILNLLRVLKNHYRREIISNNLNNFLNRRFSLSEAIEVPENYRKKTKRW